MMTSLIAIQLAINDAAFMNYMRKIIILDVYHNDLYIYKDCAYGTMLTYQTTTVSTVISDISHS